VAPSSSIRSRFGNGLFREYGLTLAWRCLEFFRIAAGFNTAIEESGDIMQGIFRAARVSMAGRRVAGRLAGILTAVFAGLWLTASAARAAQGTYPDRPLRIIVPFAPGGTVDQVARLIGPELAKRLGQAVLVENRGGAGTIVGTEYAARSVPDGYTLYLAVSTVTTNPGLYPKLPYNVIKDFQPISLIARMPVVPFANPKFPPRDVKQLVQYAIQHPNDVSFGSPGYGTMSGMTAELLKERTGAQMTHILYKGGAPSMNDALAGHIQMTWGTIAQGVEQHKAGTLRALGVSSEHRHPLLPDVPTFKQLGIDIVTTEWYGLMTPTGTPQPIVDRLNKEMRAIVATPGFGAAFPAYEFVSSSPDELGAFIRQETDRWTPLIRKLGIKPE
jgi:tripartite-type tricarboxylate transporter receptor subunit TctC